MKILLATDGSPRSAAQAHRLADNARILAGAPEIHVLYVYNLSPGLLDDAGMYRASRRSEAALGEVSSILSAARLDCITAWRIGRPAEEIARYVHDLQIDIVAGQAGTHGALDGLQLAREPH